MIGHQAAAQYADSCVIELLLQESQVGIPILVGRENFAPVHTSLRDVAGNVRQHASVAPRHAHDCTEKSRSSGCPLFARFSFI